MYHSCIQNGEICCLFYQRNSVDFNPVSITFFIHASLLYASIQITVPFIRCLLLISRLIQHYKWLCIHLYTFTATCFGCKWGNINGKNWDRIKIRAYNFIIQNNGIIKCRSIKQLNWTCCSVLVTQNMSSWNTLRNCISSVVINVLLCLNERFVLILYLKLISLNVLKIEIW